MTSTMRTNVQNYSSLFWTIVLTIVRFSIILLYFVFLSPTRWASRRLPVCKWHANNTSAQITLWTSVGLVYQTRPARVWTSVEQKSHMYVFLALLLFRCFHLYHGLHFALFTAKGPVWGNQNRLAGLGKLNKAQALQLASLSTTWSEWHITLQHGNTPGDKAI